MFKGNSFGYFDESKNEAGCDFDSGVEEVFFNSLVKLKSNDVAAASCFCWVFGVTGYANVSKSSIMLTAVLVSPFPTSSLSPLLG